MVTSHDHRKGHLLSFTLPRALTAAGVSVLTAAGTLTGAGPAAGVTPSPAPDVRVVAGTQPGDAFLAASGDGAVVGVVRGGAVHLLDTRPGAPAGLVDVTLPAPAGTTAVDTQTLALDRAGTHALAYALVAIGHWRLYRFTLDPGAAPVVHATAVPSSDLGQDEFTAWGGELTMSRDGSTVAWHAVTYQSGPTSTMLSSQLRTWVAGTAASSVRQSDDPAHPVGGPAGARLVGVPALSADGTRVAYVTSAQAGCDVWVAPTDPRVAPTAVNRDGAGHRTDATCPGASARDALLSGPGTTAAYLVPNGPPDVYPVPRALMAVPLSPTAPVTVTGASVAATPTAPGPNVDAPNVQIPLGINDAGTLVAFAGTAQAGSFARGEIVDVNTVYVRDLAACGHGTGCASTSLGLARVLTCADGHEPIEPIEAGALASDGRVILPVTDSGSIAAPYGTSDGTCLPGLTHGADPAVLTAAAPTLAGTDGAAVAADGTAPAVTATVDRHGQSGQVSLDVTGLTGAPRAVLVGPAYDPELAVMAAKPVTATAAPDGWALSVPVTLTKPAANDTVTDAGTYLLVVADRSGAELRRRVSVRYAPAVAPGAPSIDDASGGLYDSGRGYVYVHWAHATPGANTATTTRYTVSLYTAASATVAVQTTTLAPSTQETSFDVSASGAYWVRVQAISAAGGSALSAAAGPVSFGAPPPPPVVGPVRGLTAAADSGGVWVRWTAPANASAAGWDRSVVCAAPGRAVVPLSGSCPTVGLGAARRLGLTGGRDWTVTVYAHGASGWSAPASVVLTGSAVSEYAPARAALHRRRCVAVRLSGTLTTSSRRALAWQWLTVWAAAPGGGRWTRVASARTDGYGRYSAAVALSASRDLRVVYSGNRDRLSAAAARRVVITS